MSIAPIDPIDRAWWHLHLSPDLLYADQREQPACSAEPLEFDDCEDYEQGQACEHCGGDGRDPWSDYLLECPACLGEGVRW